MMSDWADPFALVIAGAFAAAFIIAAGAIWLALKLFGIF